MNDKTPTRSAISEPDQAEMEEFLAYVQLLVNTMGFRVFEPLIRQIDNSSVLEDEFQIKAARGANAKGQRVTDGFVVFAGSKASQSTVPSLPKSLKANV